MRTFTIRVYGICRHKNKVLVTDEFIDSQYVTKFPGGGLEWGEGTRDCLIREMMEETGEQIEVLDHIYTTDFFLQSVFNPEKQVVSIYYNFRFLNPTKFPIKEKPFDFQELIPDAQIFRWIDLDSLREENFTLPVEKMMVKYIRQSLL
jgi:8-oxo-dGTP diphosphatase